MDMWLGVAGSHPTSRPYAILLCICCLRHLLLDDRCLPPFVWSIHDLPPFHHSRHDDYDGCTVSAAIMHNDDAIAQC